jgi:hypothetical protein
MKRNLLFPIILTQALTANAFLLDERLEKASGELHTKLVEYNKELQSLCGDDKPMNEKDLEEVRSKSGKIWKQIQDQINNARIKIGVSDRVELSGRSSVEFGQKYSGKDIWRVGASVTLLESSLADLSLSGSREVTFIQQFPSRCKSLIRIAYDPITKVPLNSDRALNRLKPGDFVAFSSPLTLSLGKGLEKFVGESTNLKLLGGASFNIHVYRMENDNVRVRFFATKTDGVSLNLGVRFYAISDLLRITPLEVSLGRSNSDIFSADYVFNLKNEKSRIMYDKLMSEKFDLTKLAFEGINPFEKDNTVRSRLFKDLGPIEQAASDDLKVNLEERRVVRLAKGDSNTKSNSTGFGINLVAVKAKMNTIYSTSTVSQTNVNNENRNYIIKTITRQNEYNFFEYWGQEDSHNTALLVQTDDQYNPLFATGLQTIRVREELAFSKDEIIQLQNRLYKTLPKQITLKLALPEVGKLKGNISNARIEQSIFLDAQALEKIKSVDYAKVEAELRRLITTWGKLTSPPKDTERLSEKEKQSNFRSKAKYDADIKLHWSQDEKAVAFAGAKYLEAYSYELSYIPQGLTTLFGSASIQEKMKAYDQLQEIALFNELGISLVLNLIPENSLADVLTYKLTVTGRGIDPKITEFPSTDDATALQANSRRNGDIFQRILNDNAFLNDRSFNLKYYMNEKGDSLSLKEVVARAQ